MLINSLSFLLFFAVVFFVYYFPLRGNTKYQNILLLIASYFFYGYADLRLLPILVGSTLLFYFLGIAMERNTKGQRQNLLMTVGVVAGVGLLLYFKYANFFIASFAALLQDMGFGTSVHTLNIIAPLGISFYTFRLLSYVIDIQRGKGKPTNDLVAFSAYVAFFPTILSGPIDRAASFIPQLEKKRIFNYEMAVDGLRQILWGLFKKIVIADQLALAIGEMDASPSGSTMALVAVLYLFQLYADFSGYSDMAIGVGKLLGFRIAVNFNYPLFALNIADYWRRWHISLTGWLTDYIFMPLSVKWRDWGKWGLILAILVTFALIGMWHGAALTFLLFGFYHGLLYVPLILSGAMFKKNKIKTTFWGLPAWPCAGKMIVTMLLAAFGLVIFRASGIPQAFDRIHTIFSSSFFSFPFIAGKQALLFVVIMLIIEWFSRDREFGLQLVEKIRFRSLRWLVYFVFLFVIMNYSGNQTAFIYFQF